MVSLNICDGGNRISASEEDFEVTLEERLQERLDARLEAGLANLRAELAAELLGVAGKAGPPRGGQGHEKALPSTKEGVIDEAAGDDAGKLAEVRLSESIWDAAVLLGVDELGLGASLLLAVGLVLNILVQVVFSFIVLENLMLPEFSKGDLKGLEAWRLKIAHDHASVSTAGGSSMAERVCAGDVTLSLASEQASTVKLIRDYLPSLNPEATSLQQYLPGHLMCVLALIVWCLVLSKEANSILDFLSALWHLPQSRSSKLTRTATGSLRLESLSRSRHALAALLAALRAGIAGFLLYIGGMYLANTVTMTDLLLNAAALELIVSIDELIFEAMVPAVARELVADLEPLHRQRWPRWHKVDVKACAVPVLLAGLIVLFWFTGIQVTVRNLMDAYAMICGGNTSFTYTIDGLGMVHVQDLPRFSPEVAWNIEDFSSRSIREVVDNVPPESWDYALFADPTLPTVVQKGVEHTVLGIFNPRLQDCHDSLDPELPPRIRDIVMRRPGFHSLTLNQQRVFPRYLQYLLGRAEPVRSCGDVQQHCFVSNGSSMQLIRVLRAFCPVTCGCNSLIRGSYYVSAKFGCPKTCLTNLDDVEKDRMPCEDINGSGVGDPRMATARSWLEEMASLPHDGNDPRGPAVTNPCLMVTWNPEMCTAQREEDGFIWAATASDRERGRFSKVMTYMCPVACGCSNPNSLISDAACPKLCTCPWDISINIPKNSVVEECRVVFRFGSNASSAPVRADARCCHLMQKSLELMDSFSTLGTCTWTDGFLALYNLWQLVQAALCHPCRKSCLEALWAMRFPSMGNATLGQLMAPTVANPVDSPFCAPASNPCNATASQR